MSLMPHALELTSYTCPAGMSTEGNHQQLEADQYLGKGLAAESGTKKYPERHQEMATADAAQIKECVRPGCQQEDAPEAMPVNAT